MLFSVSVAFLEMLLSTSYGTWKREKIYLNWKMQFLSSDVPRNFFRGGGGGVQQIQLRTEDRENRDLGGGGPLVRGSGGSCNLVKEISFHKVKFS